MSYYLAKLSQPKHHLRFFTLLEHQGLVEFDIAEPASQIIDCNPVPNSSSLLDAPGEPRLRLPSTPRLASLFPFHARPNVGALSPSASLTAFTL
ncbi:hypothetical protein MY11210_003867 [Beauveria gryllotalpidicola]